MCPLVASLRSTGNTSAFAGYYLLYVKKVDYFADRRKKINVDWIERRSLRDGISDKEVAFLCDLIGHREYIADNLGLNIRRQ